MTTQTPNEPKHVVMFNGDQPIYFAIDTTASMQTRDAHLSALRSGPDAPTYSQSRYEYARERVDELLSRLPRDTRATVLTFDAAVGEVGNELAGNQARAVLSLTGEPMGAVTNTGRVLEHIAESFWNTRRSAGRINAVMPEATLVILTDGLPDDLWRFEAFLRELIRTYVLGAVVVLWLGEGEPRDNDDKIALHFGQNVDEQLTGRVSVVRLSEDTEIRMSTRTQSDKPEHARAPTVPPSLSPPKPDAPANPRPEVQIVDDPHTPYAGPTQDETPLPRRPQASYRDEDARPLVDEQDKAEIKRLQADAPDEPHAHFGTTEDIANRNPNELNLPEARAELDAQRVVPGGVEQRLQDAAEGTEYVEPTKHAPAPKTHHADPKVKTSHTKRR